MVDNIWVMRCDAGTLRAPVETDQGFLRVDGYVGRPGIYQYVNNAEDEKNGMGPIGKVRREFRPDNEVFNEDALNGFEGAPLTLFHPGERITTDNVRRFEVGTCTGRARREGARVSASMVIKDKRAIASVKADKTRQLSPGYKMRVERTSGVDPKYGAYDFIQRDIKINHLALVDRARGGGDLQLRMDGLDAPVEVNRADDFDGCCDSDDIILLTDAVDGHQHTVCLDTDDSAGQTSYATAEKADAGHMHMWIRNSDGSITIAEDSGHTHVVQSVAAAVDPVAAAVAQIGSALDAIAASRNDSAAHQPRQGASTMNPEEQIRSLKAQLEEAEKSRDTAAGALAVTSERADKADATIQTLQDQISELTTKIAAGATAAESVAIKTEAERADRAEAVIAQHDQKFDEAVKKRTATMFRAARVMGSDFRMDRMSERDIQAVVVKKLRPAEDIGKGVTDAYIAGRFDSLVEAHDKTARSHLSVGEIISSGDQGFRNDAAQRGGNGETAETRRNNWRNQARQKIPAPARQKGG